MTKSVSDGPEVRRNLELLREAERMIAWVDGHLNVQMVPDSPELPSCSGEDAQGSDQPSDQPVLAVELAGRNRP